MLLIACSILNFNINFKRVSAPGASECKSSWKKLIINERSEKVLTSLSACLSVMIKKKLPRNKDWYIVSSKISFGGRLLRSSSVIFENVHKEGPEFSMYFNVAL